MLFLLLSLASAQELPEYLALLPEVPASHTTVRKRVYEVHLANPTTLYCGCTYTDKTPDLKSCGLGDQSGFRWDRTEVEHVVPAAALGTDRPCWEEGGRDHCIQVDPIYKVAHSDLHNLWPSIGGINNARSAKAMGLLAGEERLYGTCDFEVNEEMDRVEPRPEVRGDIARIYFYMEWMYGLQISEGQRRLLLHWHQTDPVDEWERTRDARIKALQGNSNPFVH